MSPRLAINTSSCLTTACSMLGCSCCSITGKSHISVSVKTHKKTTFRKTYFSSVYKRWHSTEHQIPYLTSNIQFCCSVLCGCGATSSLMLLGFHHVMARDGKWSRLNQSWTPLLISYYSKNNVPHFISQLYFDLYLRPSCHQLFMPLIDVM